MERTRKLLRLPEVIDRTGLSRSMIYLLITQNQFPESIKLGRRMVAWVEEEVDEWIQDKISTRRGGKGK